MVANHDQELRAHRLWRRIAEYMEQGKRDPKEVADVLQVIHDHRDFNARLRGSPVPVPLDLDFKPQLKDWQNFLKKFCNIKLDTAKLQIPNHPDGFNWPIVMPKGLTLQKIVETMKKHMNVYLYIDLNKVTSDRNSDKDYVILVRDRVEADEELKNKSADDLKKDGVNGITLPERLLLEFFYWWKTRGKHLDEKNYTMCSGSRCIDASGAVGVPLVYWDPSYRGVCVSWYYLDGRDDGIRSRQAVS